MAKQKDFKLSVVPESEVTGRRRSRRSKYELVFEQLEKLPKGKALRVELRKGEEEKAARNIRQAVTGWGRRTGKKVSVSVDEGVLFVVLVAQRGRKKRKR